MPFIRGWRPKSIAQTFLRSATSQEDTVSGRVRHSPLRRLLDRADTRLGLAAASAERADLVPFGAADPTWAPYGAERVPWDIDEDALVGLLLLRWERG